MYTYCEGDLYFIELKSIAKIVVSPVELFALELIQFRHNVSKSVLNSWDDHYICNTIK
jgi:hypothetical protein